MMKHQASEDEWLMLFSSHLAGVQATNRWGPDETGGLL